MFVGPKLKIDADKFSINQKFKFKPVLLLYYTFFNDSIYMYILEVKIIIVIAVPCLRSL